VSAPLFVAEVSSNHARDLDRCLAFVDAAADAGCGAVKFQLFRIRELFAPEILARSEEHRRREQWELPVDFLAPIAERARARGLAFWCTPFDLRAVAELEPYVDVLKVASYELLWDDLLEACARTGKPVCLSTGMATLDEIERAVGVLRAAGCADLTLLHCVSGYPAPAAECNLAAIETLRRFGAAVGWSDHSVDPAVVARAVHRFDAAVVEFHLDLDGRGDEFKTGHCWLPEQIAPVIGDLARALSADGDGVKAPVPSELPDREWRADPSDGLRPFLHVRAEWRAQAA
jgi:N-acetylneuraminate synthase